MSRNDRFQHQFVLTRIIYVLFGLVVFQNLLPPNSFSATVLLFDYEFGLIRRGLFGEIGNLFWGETVSKSEVFAASAAISIAGLLALFVLIRRRLFTTQAGMFLALILFGSFAFRAIVSSTGYMDLLLLALIALALLSDPKRASGVAFRCLAVVLGMFFHEVMLPYYAVFLVFDLWIARHGEDRIRRIGVAFLPFAGGLAAFLLLALAADLPAQNVPAYFAYLDAKADINLEPDATVVMERSILDNLAMMQDKRAEMGYRAWVVFDGIPLILMSFWIGWLNFQIAATRHGFVTGLLIVGAIAAPLSLNVIAFDVIRFGSTSVLIGFLALLSQLRADPNASARLATVLTWPHFLAVLVFNLSITVNQLNVGEAHVYRFPWVFLEQLAWLN